MASLIRDSVAAHRPGFGFVVAATLLAGLPVPRLLAAGIQIVVPSGTLSPNGNGTLSQFFAPSVGAGGALSFLSQLSGTSGGASDNLALYRRSTLLQQIARTGNTTLGGVLVTSFPTNPLAPAWTAADGTVRFIAGTGSVANPVLQPAVGNAGALDYIVAPGSLSPNGNALTNIQSLTVNDAGTAAFVANYGNGAEQGVYRRTSTGVLAAQVLLGSTAPRGGTVTATSSATINESNQVATLITINSGGSTLTSALRISNNTTRREMARQGDVTTTGAATLQAILATPLVNSAGQVAFMANYTQAAGNGRGIFIASDTTLKLAAPRTLTGITGTIANSQIFGLTTAGNVGFWAEGNTGADPLSGLFVSDGTTVTQIALEDTALPSGGKYIRRFFTESLAYNANGQMAFLVELSNTVNGAATGRALLEYDPAGGLREIVKTGDALGTGVVAADGIFFTGALSPRTEQSPDSSMSGLNDAGLIGFGYALTNGGGGIATWTKPNQPADFNGDGIVNGADLTRWKTGFGKKTGAVTGDGNADGDGDVDGADFLIWQRQFGTSAVATGAPLSTAVPEPTALISALILAALRLAVRPMCRRR